VPISAGQCDEQNACPPNQVCVFPLQVCADSCTKDDDCGQNLFCEPCATGSCCGCKNCVAACMGGL
jgi:hypothetical protein